MFTAIMVLPSEYWARLAHLARERRSRTCVMTEYYRLTNIYYYCMLRAEKALAKETK